MVTISGSFTTAPTPGAFQHPQPRHPDDRKRHLGHSGRAVGGDDLSDPPVRNCGAENERHELHDSYRSCPHDPCSRPPSEPTGTSVTITGTNFSGTVSGATFTATGVTFNNLIVTFLVNSATEIKEEPAPLRGPVLSCKRQSDSADPAAYRTT
jgi:hypothetical protein